MKEIKLKSQPKWLVRMFILIGVILGGVFAFVSHPMGTTSAQSVDCPEGKFLATGDVCITNEKDIVIQATATEANQTLKINKYFANAYTVDRGDGTTGNLTSDTTHTYSTAGTYEITLSLIDSTNKWICHSAFQPLIPRSGTMMTGVQIIYMPSFVEGFWDDSISLYGQQFFVSFNQNGALTSLPEGSFDISNITSAGDAFFYNFNKNGELMSLPDGSFDTSNITSVGNSFFGGFNANGALTSLPEGSFDISNITSAGNDFFARFNANGALTSLPGGSFDMSNITTAGDLFFSYFNYSGHLTSLPDGSFDTSNIITAGDGFFDLFNTYGALTSLPVGSFNISNITTIGVNFFAGFNSLGSLIALPEGSFDISNITSVGSSFFNSFNFEGSLTSLPEGSFDTSNITTAGNGFFTFFNENGAITSLPEGSFDMSNITTAGNDFFYGFNRNGAITNLPDSFKLTSAAYDDKNRGYLYSFNSSYTINRKVSDLVSGVVVPSVDRNTFSSNQPGVCGVHANWLGNSKGACTIVYDANGGNGTTTGLYESNATNVVAGSDIILPTNLGYALKGWYTQPEGGEKIENVIFPLMDGKTLYAKWGSGLTVTFDVNGGISALSPVTVDDNSQIQLPIVYMDGYNFLGWYTEAEGGERVGGYNSNYTVTADITLYAHWEQTSFTVVFNSNGGDSTPASRIVSKNMVITLPDVYRNGYVFLGWYTEAGGGERIGGYYSTYTVTHDITLYAHRSSIPKIRFLDGDDVIISAEKYWDMFGNTNYGDHVYEPDLRNDGDFFDYLSQKDGQILVGWFTDKNFIDEFDFQNTTIEGDIDLYAKWKHCSSGYIAINNKVCVLKSAGVSYENGIIKVSDGERTMYIRDRNAGGVSDSSVLYLKLNLISRQYNNLLNNQCSSQCNDSLDYSKCYDECYNSKFVEKFVEEFEEGFGVLPDKLDELYYSLQLDLLEGLLTGKEMEAYKLNLNVDIINFQCEGEDDPSDCALKKIRDYINVVFNPNSELADWDDLDAWAVEYFGGDEFEEFSNKYPEYYGDLMNAQANGDYYYRGNNSGISFNDLKFDSNSRGMIINKGDLIGKGFDGGKMGLDGQGWISGNVNPCDPEKGEYLPTPEDWKTLMEIWGNANGYDLIGGEVDTYNYEGIDYPLYYYGLDLDTDGGNKLNSDLLLPDGGDIFEDMCRNEETQNNESCLGWEGGSSMFWTLQDGEGNLGFMNNGGLGYMYTNVLLDSGIRPGNNGAISVRCFVNPAEIPAVYVVSFETNRGDVISDVNVIKGDTVTLPIPSKSSYTFDGWYTDSSLSNEFDPTTPIINDMTLYAKWKKDSNSSSSIGGGGSSLKKDNCPDGDYSDSYYDGTCGKKPNEKDDEKDSSAKPQNDTGTTKNDNNKHNSADEIVYDTLTFNPHYSDDMNKAYQYSYHYGITTKNNIRDAAVNQQLTRIAMAKMLSQYAVNVLGIKPDATRNNEFADVSDKLDTEYGDGVTLAYQLGIMGINMPNNKFRPYGYVTRAEFATALSRLLYNTSDGEFEKTSKYYVPHINKLAYEGILTNTDPYMKELRGYVMLMLMRSAK